MTFRRRLVTAGQHRYRNPAGRNGGGQWAIYRPGLTIRAIAEIETHSGPANRQLDFERYDLIVDTVVIHQAFADINAIGQFVEVTSDRCFAVIEYSFHRALKIFAPESIDDLGQLAGADTQAADLGFDIAGEHFWQTRVGQHAAIHVIDPFAFAVELDAGEERALLINIGSIRAIHSIGADIEPVRFDDRIPYQVFIIAGKYGLYQSCVLRMRSRSKRPVIENHVAGLDISLAPQCFYSRFDAETERAHKQRQRGRLRQQADLAVVQRNGKIQHFVNYGRECRPHQSVLHLIGGRIQRVSDNLGIDHIDSALPRGGINRPARLCCGLRCGLFRGLFYRC